MYQPLAGKSAMALLGWRARGFEIFDMFQAVGPKGSLVEDAVFELSFSQGTHLASCLIKMLKFLASIIYCKLTPLYIYICLVYTVSK